MHRDLKLENIMMDLTNAKGGKGELVCKITDFGFARTISDSLEKDIEIGTPIAMAPELVRRKHHDNRVDVWALGVITTELLFGHEPFNGHSKEEIFDKILHAEPNLSSGPK